MDSADELLMMQMDQDDADAEADEEELLLVIACLLRRRARLRTPQRGGSRKGKKPNKDCNRYAGALMLDADYFVEHPLHGPEIFRRRFRMNREVFKTIVEGVRRLDPYFMCKPDCTGLIGFTSYQKCMVALRCLAYGAPLDTADDYLRRNTRPPPGRPVMSVGTTSQQPYAITFTHEEENPWARTETGPLALTLQQIGRAHV